MSAFVLANGRSDCDRPTPFFGEIQCTLYILLSQQHLRFSKSPSTESNAKFEVVIEERLSGPECSVLAFCDAQTAVCIVCSLSSAFVLSASFSAYLRTPFRALYSFVRSCVLGFAVVVLRVSPAFPTPESGRLAVI